LYDNFLVSLAGACSAILVWYILIEPWLDRHTNPARYKRMLLRFQNIWLTIRDPLFHGLTSFITFVGITGLLLLASPQAIIDLIFLLGFVLGVVVFIASFLYQAYQYYKFWHIES